ncbi:Ig-like domain-containing protein [Anaeromyxobacter oryzisoli]|uniref:Ig-like domain-containing protein n=1 Tax=Anaeromyxobacter oryzisoli TaxID=2925408 RepID=UPI001F57A804|nr:Ig-like domain-containing protein [Anaeromyxobacter sp. SG63]
MRIRQAILVLAIAASACQGSHGTSVQSPERTDKLVRAAEPIAGQYVATLVDGLGEAEARALVARHGGTFLAYVPAPVNAVALQLAPERAIALAEDAAVRVAEEDGRVHAASATWNLDRIDQRSATLDGAYRAATTGAGVNVYVVDTGVLLAHPDLAGRADAPASFAEGPSDGDCNGHGTHLAGVAAGATIGVAPGAKVHSVRALDCAGVGSVSTLIQALDWIRQHHAAPAVALVGVTAGLSPSLEAVVRELVKSGVTVVAPAGNDAVDACGHLPAAVPEALTVGATTYQDAALAPSAQGRCVDLFAPGAQVYSSWNDGTHRFATGTSQAAAHVAGAAALFLEARPDAAPATVSAALVGNATLGVLAGVSDVTPNRLLHVGFIAPGLSADTTAPGVRIAAPADGAVASGTATVSVTADPTGVSQVAVFVDGVYLGGDADGADGYAVSWPTARFANGPHTVLARAYDAAGNVGEHAITITVTNPGNAAYDPELKAPACADPGQRCASGALLAGRGPLGPEANAPNTIRSLCADGLAGTYRQDESVEAIEVQTSVPGADLAEGEWVDVDVRVWAYPDHETDRVDLYFAADAGAPVWQYFGTHKPAIAGEQTVRFTYRLPALPSTASRKQQAVRAAIHYGGAPAECSSGPYDDHDDLAFAVRPGTPDTTRPFVRIDAPVAGPVENQVQIRATAWDDAGGAIARVDFLADGVVIGTATELIGGGYAANWDANAASAMPHTLRAVAYDKSGNSFTSDPVVVTPVDTTPPSVAIDLPAKDAVVGGFVHLEALASDGRGVATVQFFSGGELLGTAVTPPWAIDWDTRALAGGAVEVVAVAVDASGNQAQSTPLPLVLDNVPPTASIVAPAPGATASGREVAIQVSAADDQAVDRVEVFAAGAFVGNAALVGGRWTLTWNAGLLPNGEVTLEARAYDRSGNVSPPAAITVQVLDTTRPVVAFLEPAAGAIVHGIIPVGASATDDGVIDLVAFDAGALPLGTSSAAPYQIAWNTAGTPDGKVTLGAVARDRAGLEGSASIEVTVDNSGPVVGVDAPAAGPVTGDVSIQLHASDPTGVERVDVWAGDVFLGKAAATGDGAYALQWTTTGVDNRAYSLVAVAFDLVGNSTASAAVPVTVKNLTTAEYDAALGAPACASSAAWCWSGTLLDGAASHEANPPSTLGGACGDGAGSAYHVTESIDSLRVEAYQGALASNGTVQVSVRYWAYVGNEADQIDVWHAADARNPTWTLLRTITPAAAGAGEDVFDLTLPAGPLQVIRANFRFAQPGPSTCSGGEVGDRDDLVFAVDSPADTVAPVVALQAPLDGGTVGGLVHLRATAQDAQGVTRVEFRVDGALVAAPVQPLPGGGATPLYEALWDASAVADGRHTLAATAYDTSGNATATSTIRFTVQNAANAALDASLGVPACSAGESFCDTGALIDGRGIPVEPNAPNTIHASCTDGDQGVYHQDESLDWLKVSSVDGLALTAGKRARVESRVWSYTGWSDDALDLFYTTTPDAPSWVWFATLKPSAPGAQLLTAEYVLPSGARQAIRGRFRYGGAVAACGTGTVIEPGTNKVIETGLYDDHDDLVFAVAP